MPQNGVARSSRSRPRGRPRVIVERVPFQCIRSRDAKDGAPFGQKFFDSVKEGSFATVAYNFPKPGGTEAVPKEAYLTKVGNQGCGVGYYK